jgi:hypothetical protein
MLIRQERAQTAIAAHVEHIEAALRRERDRMFVKLWGRDVGAQRARKLRRRGESVMFQGYSPSGRARYRWMPKPGIVVLECGVNDMRLNP